MAGKKDDCLFFTKTKSGATPSKKLAQVAPDFVFPKHQGLPNDQNSN
jgi:hypothetical protein